MEMPFLWFAFIHVALGAFIIAGYAMRYQVPWALFWWITAMLLVFVVYMPLDTLQIEYLANGSAVTNYMDQLTSSTGITLRNDAGGAWIRGELVANSASAIANKEVNCLTAQLSRNNSPDFNTPIIFGVFDSSANIKYEFGRMNVTETTSSIQFFERCNMTNNYTIVSGDRVAISWNDGTSTDNIAIRLDATDPFDGSNTQASAWDGSWTNTSGTDYAFIIGLDPGGTAVTTVPYDISFTGPNYLMKVMLIFMAAIVGVMGAMMELRSRR